LVENNDPIIGRTVISEPGAGFIVTKLELSDEAKNGLTVDAASLHPFLLPPAAPNRTQPRPPFVLPPPLVIHAGSPSDLHFDGETLRDGSGRAVTTRPLTSGRVAALHSARVITSEEAARLATSSLDPDAPPMPRWVLAALFFVLGFIFAEVRLSCLVTSVTSTICGAP
jgi:hypothetical protein